MVLHHFYAVYVLVGDAVGGDAVLSSQQVFAFDVELIDRCALVRNLPIVRHLYAGQLLQDVPDGAVTFFREACHVVDNRVPLCPYLRSFHDDFLDLDFFGLQADAVRLVLRLDRAGHRGISQAREAYHRLYGFGAVRVEAERPVLVRNGEGKDAFPVCLAEGDARALQRSMLRGIGHFPFPGPWLGVEGRGKAYR